MHTPTRMTPSKAFMETLVVRGVTTVFGIAGSTFLGLYGCQGPVPRGRNRLVSGAHAQNEMRSSRSLLRGSATNTRA